MTNNIINKEIKWEELINFSQRSTFTTLNEAKNAAIEEINLLANSLGDDNTYNTHYLSASNIEEVEEQKKQFLERILNDYLWKVELIYNEWFLKVSENEEEQEESEESSVAKKVTALQIFIDNLQLFKIQSSSGNSLKEALAAVYQEKSQKIDLLISNLENELLILKEDFTELRKKLSKLFTTLSCLGVKEEEMGEDIKHFFSQILGKKNLTGENTTLRDIKSIEGINNLQDLFNILNYLNEEYERQETLEREEESSEVRVSIVNEPEWIRIKNLSKRNLIEYLEKEKEKVTNDSETKELITDVLALLWGEKKSLAGEPTPEEKEKIGEIVAQIIIAKNRRVLTSLFKELGEYGRKRENSYECIKFIIEITNRCAGKLASFDNSSKTPRTPSTPCRGLPKASEKKTLIQMMKETKGKLKMAEILLGKPVNNYILGCLNLQGEELEEFKKKNWAQIIEEHEVFCQKQKEEIKQLRYIAVVLALTTIISFASNLFLLIKKWYGGEKRKKG